MIEHELGGKAATEVTELFGWALRECLGSWPEHERRNAMPKTNTHKDTLRASATAAQGEVALRRGCEA